MIFCNTYCQRESLGDRNTDKLQWFSFFSVIKNAFYGRAVSLQFKDDMCIVNIELIISGQKTFFSVKLKKMDNLIDHYYSVFVQPLYELYTLKRGAPSDSTTERLEKQIKAANVMNMKILINFRKKSLFLKKN